MAVFSKYTIQKYIKQGKLGFFPELTLAQYQPHSVDLRLGYDFYIPKLWKLTEAGRQIVNVDLSKPADNFEHIQLKKGQSFELAPGEFVIGVTLEKVMFNSTDYMAVLYPRSSINRRGLSIDLTGIIDTGYKGKLFVPIRNQTSNQIIKVLPEERFVTIVFYQLDVALTEQDSRIHGVKPPKYQDSDGFMAYKPDTQD